MLLTLEALVPIISPCKQSLVVHWNKVLDPLKASSDYFLLSWGGCLSEKCETLGVIMDKRKSQHNHFLIYMIKPEINESSGVRDSGYWNFLDTSSIHFF